ncbi:MAG: signal peptidase I [Bacteroidota bacterium]|nr:signal peptidase I [Bacteroidota bacterium]MDP4205376.1 signal peptidase I [Bacteroidota bacterium]
MRNVLTNKWFKFGTVTLFYCLWVLWLQNFWWLIGVPVLFDIYITKKVHWAFWKKKNPPQGKQTKVVEWIDAIIFAVIAATFIRLFFVEAYTIPTSSMEKSLMVGDYLFVSKLSYGPKLPNTPLSFPFVHHTLPFCKTTKSYLEWIKNPYKRIAGLGKVKNNDVVVFNFPEGDTVALNQQSASYYQLVRASSREAVWSDKNYFGDVVARPVDKRENYIKRCIGIPGDEVKIVNGQAYVNGKAQTAFKGIQYNYQIITDGSGINPKALDRLGIPMDDRQNFLSNKYIIPLTDAQVQEIKGFKNVLSVTKILQPQNSWDRDIFPFSDKYPWNVDNFGPIRIPKKGVTIKLTIDNLPIYQRIIGVYEGNKLEVKGNTIYINGFPTTSYCFKMDYYWMQGDNRHNSADSRYWGFVPEDHIVGKAVFVWLSLDKDKEFLSKIRWDRLFRFI